MFERFTARAKRALEQAEPEARALGDDSVGSEHVLLGILQVPECVAALALVRHGVTYERVRAEVSGDGVRQVDADALASVGIDLDEVRRAVEGAFGPGALNRAVAGRRRGRGRPLTPDLKKVLALALREALALHHNDIGTEHVLLGIVRDQDSPAAEILARLAPGADLRGTVLAMLAQAS